MICAGLCSLILKIVCQCNPLFPSCSRFIVNVPEEERKDLVRLCFQIELAHWFYIDFYCSEEGSTRKHCSFKEFAANIFKVVFSNIVFIQFYRNVSYF